MDRPPHALVIGLPQLGHWLPIKFFFLQLARQKVSLTVLCTRERAEELEGLKKDGAFQALNNAEFWEVFIISEKNPFLAAGEMFKQILHSPSVKEKLISQISAGHGPTFVVADMLLAWTQNFADELGIPRYIFYTSPTTMALITLHTKVLLDDEEKYRDTPDEYCNYLGLEEFRFRDVPAGVYYAKEHTSIHFQYFIKTAGVVINSFEPFESSEAAALRSGLERIVGAEKAPKVFLVGPLSYLPPFPSSLRMKESEPKADNSACLSFLDTQPATSVLYICFGSHARLNETSVKELARALELSDFHFLWVLPCPENKGKDPQSEVDLLLPTGFKSRTKGKGLVWTEWAPQVEIFSHPSVGGFLSHCGWNSCLDAIRGRVPIICWPQGAEQSLNARSLSHLAKVGIPLETFRLAGDAKSNEITKAIQTLMNSEEGEKCRMNMRELQKSALASVEEGGSSHKAFQDFMQDISMSARH